MKNKKYKLTGETITYQGRVLRRIEALKDLSDVKKGDKGGFVESENNLSQKDNCWIYNNAKVCGNARVLINARVCDDAIVCGNAQVGDNAKVGENAKVCDNAIVYDRAEVYENSIVCSDAQVCGYATIFGNAVIADKCDYIVFKNWWSSGRHFTWTKSNNMWSVGCFYGTGKELIEKSYEDSELSGREYERVVKYVESIIKEK